MASQNVDPALNAQHATANGHTARAAGRIADFFIIGAAKSGTTTLYDYLALHPQICMSSEKEPCYFNSSHPYSQRGLDWYHSLFSAARDGQICGEATTNYSAWPKTPDAPELIAQHVPHAKFIYMLREPVQRTYSHFIHRHEREVFVGKPYRMTFEEFAEHDPVVLYASDYASQVARYLAHFPKNSILPLVFEDFTNDRERALAKVFRFLEVEDLSASLGAQSMHKNSRKVHHADMARARIAASVRRWIPGIRPLFRALPRSVRSASYRAIETSFVGRMSTKGFTPPPMLPDTRKRLAARFAESNAIVADLFGLDFSSWSGAPAPGVAAGRVVGE